MKAQIQPFVDVLPEVADALMRTHLATGVMNVMNDTGAFFTVHVERDPRGVDLLNLRIRLRSHQGELIGTLDRLVQRKQKEQQTKESMDD